MAGDYWNHNVAFHRRIVRDAALRGGNALDVGCGDGLLLAHLATVCRCVVGLDPDVQVVARARRRLEQNPQAEVLLDDVMDPDLPQRIGTFETVSCVATLHHLPLEPAMARLSELVAPGGRLIVVGLAANGSLWDWVLSALAVLPLRVVGTLRRETPDIGVVTRPPRQTLAEIRAAASRLLPGATIRRRFYYRYTLIWDRPAQGVS
ncbi:bifunctional 2-polyprenyl-6-hydroxyphenol methylase/3-demethylubiquinol 3-O-methyltransferase UbiG [Actinomyces sp. oral taxon 448]|uniref:class I SAM-dependent methyltransferase n=1 Tax=Actinomyces sp. oral taxon 448 TaxID=712124 RepID=UPI0025B9EF6F|nr:class I SAM-dependent methyltransferase [Actinomyces sp. oral taxon 448]